MKICHVCRVEKAEAHMFRLGESDEPICKACQAQRSPDAEFEAMRVASAVIGPLPDAARARTIAYLSARFQQQSN